STGRAPRPQTVATKAPNAWGFHDMLGNVAEWCEDWFSPNYQRVVRGGSWIDGAKSLRVSARGKAMPGTRDYSIGLRIVRTPARYRHRRERSRDYQHRPFRRRPRGPRVGGVDGAAGGRGPGEDPGLQQGQGRREAAREREGEDREGRAPLRQAEGLRAQ